MASAYSQDLRERVIAARESGMETTPVARLFQVCPAWVRRVMQRKRESGELCARPRGGATVIKVDLSRLRQLVEETPDATAEELHARLGSSCSVSAVDVALRRLGLSFKKRRFMQPSRIGPMSHRNARRGSRISPGGMPRA